MPRTEDYPGATLAAEVLAPGSLGRLLFVAHGLSYQWGAELERELQAEAAAQLVEGFAKGRGLPAVVAGDFNATSQASSVRFWSGRQSLGGTSVCYQDAWEPARLALPLLAVILLCNVPAVRLRSRSYCCSSGRSANLSPLKARSLSTFCCQSCAGR
jgi:Endonuclease/Exonuclease/phosphatase family